MKKPECIQFPSKGNSGGGEDTSGDRGDRQCDPDDWWCLLQGSGEGIKRHVPFLWASRITEMQNSVLCGKVGGIKRHCISGWLGRRWLVAG